MAEYHYTECGLKNVYIQEMTPVVDEDDDELIVIRSINTLHAKIALGIVHHQKGISGDELRFLRTEMGQTQAELANLVHCDRSLIGQWERGERSIDSTAEIIIRMSVIEYLNDFFKDSGIKINLNISDLSRWSIPTAETQPIKIRASEQGYELVAAETC